MTAGIDKFRLIGFYESQGLVFLVRHEASVFEVALPRDNTLTGARLAQSSSHSNLLVYRAGHRFDSDVTIYAQFPLRISSSRLPITFTHILSPAHAK
jgi:hypothetical protein